MARYMPSAQQRRDIYDRLSLKNRHGMLFDKIKNRLNKNNKDINMNELDENMTPNSGAEATDAANNEPTATVENENIDVTVEEKGEDKETDKKKKDKKEKGSKEDQVQELGEKLAALNDKYVRLYSEYENYRKRTTLEKAELLLNGGKEVLKAILPIVDDMERALKNIPEDNTAREGVQLVYNKLMTMLNQKGVKEIEAMGAKFDENVHEAVTRIPASEESLKGCIVDVVEKGYMLNDKVLRFPKVVVAC